MQSDARSQAAAFRSQHRFVTSSLRHPITSLLVTVPFLVGESVRYIGLERFFLESTPGSEPQPTGMSFSGLSSTDFGTVTITPPL